MWSGGSGARSFLNKTFWMASLALWDPAAPFCPHCGSLLLLPDAGDVRCDSCPFAQPIADMAHAATRTTSFPKPTPEWLVEWTVLRQARAGELGEGADVAAEVARAGGKAAAKRAVVKEECPKCKAPQMEFYTMQLRSADEGQTVFYNCVAPGCGHTFSLNT